MPRCYSVVLNHKRKQERKILFLNPDLWESEELSFFRAPGALCTLISFTFGFAAGDRDLPHVTSVGEVIIARTHVTVLPRLRDAETRRIAGGRCVVQ